MTQTVVFKKRDSNGPSDQAGLFKVLADENRLKILGCLATGEKCVCQLTGAIDIPQNLMSHHLKVLKEAGLVADERRGRWIYYSLAAPEIGEMLERMVVLCDCAAGNTKESC